MDKLSKIRRYLVSNPEVLSQQARQFAINVYYQGSKRRSLAEVLCAAISQAIAAPYGLGEGATWFADGSKLMNDMLNSFSNSDLLTEQERERGRNAINRPHTITTMLELLAATEAAISRRREGQALARYQQQQSLRQAA